MISGPIQFVFDSNEIIFVYYFEFNVTLSENINLDTVNFNITQVSGTCIPIFVQSVAQVHYISGLKTKNRRKNIKMVVESYPFEVCILESHFATFCQISIKHNLDNFITKQNMNIWIFVWAGLWPYGFLFHTEIIASKYA